jgi:hypothetical protein
MILIQGGAGMRKTQHGEVEIIAALEKVKAGSISGLGGQIAELNFEPLDVIRSASLALFALELFWR